MENRDVSPDFQSPAIFPRPAGAFPARRRRRDPVRRACRAGAGTGQFRQSGRVPAIGASTAQKSQTASAAAAATGQTQSSGTDTTFNSIIGTINSLVNKSSASSSGSDNSAAKPGKTGGGGTNTAQADKSGSPATEDVGKSLASLKDLYERGLITKPEYDGKRKELIAKIH